MMPARLALALQADGWWIRSDIIWAKPNPMPESVTDRCTSAHEHIFMLTKSPRYYFDAQAIAEPLATLPHAPGNLATGRLTGDNCVTQPDRVWGINGTRSCRNVWTIATEAFPQSHFATFPTTLAERCIRAGTSERGCCAQCGAPWVRMVEKSGGTIGTSWHNHADDIGRGQRGGDGGHNAAAAGWKDYKVSTTGWSPSCQCQAGVAPCRVLDPFGGAGTTGLVADRLGRDAVLIELNEAYAVMARNRIVADAPLFAEVAD